MALRVTFDSNVLDLACRPERFPKDPRQSLMQKVHDALASGKRSDHRTANPPIPAPSTTRLDSRARTTARTKVVLPAPSGPRSATASPGRSERANAAAKASKAAWLSRTSSVVVRMMIGASAHE